MRDSRQVDQRDPEAVEAEEAAALTRSLTQATALAQAGRTAEALAVCRPLIARHPRDYRFLGLAGVCCARSADVRQALLYLTDALAFAPPPAVALLSDFAGVYEQVGAPMHALRTWRSLQGHYAHIPRPPALPDPAPHVMALAAQVRALPGLAGLPTERAEEALMAAERGQLRLLAQNPLDRVESECRAAMRLAPQYPGPYLTLARAQFLAGQVAAAHATLDGLLRRPAAPAAALIDRAFYSYWAGAPVDECRALLVQAELTLPLDAPPALRIALAAMWGVLGDVASVRRLLDRIVALPDPPAAAVRLIAAALANQGDRDAALELLRPLRGAPDRHLGALIAALEHEAPVPGTPGRYPYIAWDDVLTPVTFQQFLAPPPPGRHAFWRRGPAPPPRPMRERLTAAYPRVAEVGALMLWCGDPPVEHLGVLLLKLLGTPAAEVVLEAHLRGRAGSYGGRQDAGYALVDLEALPNGTVVPFWSGTDWGEVRLYRLTPGGIFPARQEADLAAQLEVVLGHAPAAPHH